MWSGEIEYIMNIYKRNKIILNFIIAFALTSVLSPVSVIAEERADGRGLLMIREENDRLESRLSGMEAGKDYIEDEAFAEEKKKEQYKTEDLFRNRKDNQRAIDGNTNNEKAMTKYKESFFKKIINKIKKLFSR